MGSKIHPPIVAVFGKNLAVLELWDLVTLSETKCKQKERRVVERKEEERKSDIGRETFRFLIS